MKACQWIGSILNSPGELCRWTHVGLFSNIIDLSPLPLKQYPSSIEEQHSQSAKMFIQNTWYQHNITWLQRRHNHSHSTPTRANPWYVQATKDLKKIWAILLRPRIRHHWSIYKTPECKVTLKKEKQKLLSPSTPMSRHERQLLHKLAWKNPPVNREPSGQGWARACAALPTKPWSCKALCRGEL